MGKTVFYPVHKRILLITYDVFHSKTVADTSKKSNFPEKSFLFLFFSAVCCSYSTFASMGIVFCVSNLSGAFMEATYEMAQPRTTTRNSEMRREAHREEESTGSQSQAGPNLQ